MKKNVEIVWNENGWTIIQDADAEKHIVEVSCFAEGGNVTEIRKRHNDGEEEKLKKAIDANHTLPMSIEDFKKALNNNEFNW